jgi:hypothetical protein
LRRLLGSAWPDPGSVTATRLAGSLRTCSP